MENKIKIFENEEFGSIRTLKEETGRVVFCGKDVAAALGYSNTKDAIKRLGLPAFATSELAL